MTVTEKYDEWLTCPALDEELRAYTASEGMPYLRDDDLHRSAFGEPPVVVNYFYHEEVKKSAKKAKE